MIKAGIQHLVFIGQENLQKPMNRDYKPKSSRSGFKTSDHIEDQGAV